MGMVFSTLEYDSNPDKPAPKVAQDDAEYLLVRARRHVHLGKLGRAVGQLDKLKGQEAFAVKDWQKNAMDRVATHKGPQKENRSTMHEHQSQIDHGSLRTSHSCRRSAQRRA